MISAFKRYLFLSLWGGGGADLYTQVRTEFAQELEVLFIMSRATKRGNHERPISWQRASALLGGQTALDPYPRTNCWKSFLNRLL